jgi:hypothetical protein
MGEEKRWLPALRAGYPEEAARADVRASAVPRGGEMLQQTNAIQVF